VGQIALEQNLCRKARGRAGRRAALFAQGDYDIDGMELSP
jgi:hypothetical protein